MTEKASTPVKGAKGESLWQDAVRRLARRKLVVACFAVILLYFGLTAFRIDRGLPADNVAAGVVRTLWPLLDILGSIRPSSSPLPNLRASRSLAPRKRNVNQDGRR